MASLPYVTSTGNIDKALNGIKSATVPEKVSQDFVKTILKIPGGSGDQMTSFLKKLGLAGSDGTPNESYRKFRNPSSSGPAIAGAIRHAYKPLYVRNEFMHELGDDELVGLIVEETGQAHDSNAVRYIFNCIKRLKTFADFEVPTAEPEATQSTPVNLAPEQLPKETSSSGHTHTVGLNLGYTIHLNLPATSDSAVFDAIFKSLKENLLSDEDA